MWTSAATDDKLEVYYVEPVGGHRGMHYYDFEFCLALQRLGVGVKLLTCDETRNVTVPPSLRVDYPFRGIYGDTWKALRGLRYLWGLVSVGVAMERQRIPLGHFHYFHFPPLDYLYLKSLHILGKHCVLTVHDVVPFDAKTSHLSWLRRLYQEADRIIVHADSNRDAIVGSFGIGSHKVRVIPMGPYLSFADRQRLPPPDAKRRLGIDPGAPVALFFGQIKRVKGLQYLIDAFGEVLGHCPSAQLLIVGPEWKESFDAYARLIRERDLNENVSTRIEYVPDEEVGLYYSAADVVVLPYTECFQSAVLYMAYSFAKPVVASAVGGLVEVIEDGVTGLLVPPADVEALAKALLTLLQDADLRNTLGNRGRQLVQDKFAWSGIARQIAVVYAEVLQGAQESA